MIIDRILQIIDYKGINKNRFYLETGLSNGFLDKVKDVGASKVEKILNAYKEINPIWLLTGKGSMFISDINTITESGFVYQNSHDDAIPLYDDEEIEEFTNKSGNIFYIYKDNTISVEVPLMTEPAYAGYIETLNEDTLKELPTTVFKVDKIGKGNYMAFTVKSDSMWNGGGYDTPSGAEILGREVGKHLWAGGFRKTDYGFILLTTKGIYHKDIKNYNSENGMITLGSRNPDVKDFQVSVNDIYKIFNVIKRSF